MEMKSITTPSPIMVLGTSSGAGKSLMAAALCRVLLRSGESPLPFKGQNMSNNAWVDKSGGEMAYSQALQAWAAGIEPTCAMNPVLLKPQGDSTSEVIHLGRSVGFAKAETYYEQWFDSGWKAICNGLNQLRDTSDQGRFVLEGAGSPVEINLMDRDLTNLRLAKYLNARCLLVADIERGGVFAQIIGTLALLNPIEKSLIKGILINRFRGRRELLEDAQKWIESKTGIPVLGIMPWLNEDFPPEDSLDLLERKHIKSSADVQIAVIKLKSISNFSDFDPLEAEESVQVRWVKPGSDLGRPDAVVIPGSKQTIKDLEILFSSGLAQEIKAFADNGGNVFGLCGGMQILGSTLVDHSGKESFEGRSTSKVIKGLDLLPIHTVFNSQKILNRRIVRSYWPEVTDLTGFELHRGISQPLSQCDQILKPLSEDPSLGWFVESNKSSKIVGTYLHGIFDNGPWRRLWLNELRRGKGLADLPINRPNHFQQRDRLLDLLADSFEHYVRFKGFIGE